MGFWWFLAHSWKFWVEIPQCFECCSGQFWTFQVDSSTDYVHRFSSPGRRHLWLPPKKCSGHACPRPRAGVSPVVWGWRISGMIGSSRNPIEILSYFGCHVCGSWPSQQLPTAFIPTATWLDLVQVELRILIVRDLVLLLGMSHGQKPNGGTVWNRSVSAIKAGKTCLHRI